MIRGRVFFLLVFWTLSAQAAPPAVNYQGRISLANGQGFKAANVSFEFELTDEVGTCVIYRELLQNIDLTQTNGVFDVKIGATHSYPAEALFNVVRAFSNSESFICDGGVVYKPGINDGRKLRVRFHDGNGWRLVSPDSVIRTIPFAAQAEDANKISGHGKDTLILKNEINAGNDCLGGSFLTWNASTKNFSCDPLSVGLGTVTHVSANNNYLTVTQGAGTPFITLNVGQTANTVAAGNDPRFADARVPSGAAGGDLAGSYPSPSVASLQGTGLDFSTPPGAGQVLTFDGNSWRAQGLPAGSSGTVTSLATGAGLVGGPIHIAGTIGLGPHLTHFLGIATQGLLQKTGTDTYSTVPAHSEAVPESLVLRTLNGGARFLGLQLTDAGSGAVELAAQDISDTYSLKLPGVPGTAQQLLANDGAGSLSWQSVPAAPGISCAAGHVLSYDAAGFTCVIDEVGVTTGAISSLAGEQGSAQSLAVGAGGLSPVWSSGGDVHRIYFPNARDASVSAGLISKAEYEAFSAKQDALPFVPLRPQQNLLELTDAAAARSSLGLGTAATHAVASGATAGSSEIVLGSDSRLSNGRSPTGIAGGDFTGSFPGPEIAKLKGVPLALGSLNSGEVLRYSSGSWQNASVATAEIQNYEAVLDLKLQKTDLAECSSAQSFSYNSVADLWSCQNLAVDDYQISYSTKTAKTFLAAPTLSAGAPSFRALSRADLPASFTDALWEAPGGNVERSGGQVGIGVNNPSARLEVAGRVKATGFCLGTECRTSWPSTAGGSVTSVSAGTGLVSSTGTAITEDGTFTVNVGTSAGQILQVAAGNKYPALNASNITTLNASAFTTGTVPLARLPSYSGDVSAVAGTGVLTLSTVSVAKGGTGSGTALAARTALLPTQSSQSGRFLKSTGSSPGWSLLHSTDVKSSMGGFFFNVSGACGAGHMLTYDASLDQVTCQAYSLSSSVTNALWSASAGNVARSTASVGIGTATPTSPLTVAGTIESTTGGLRFPDGSTQNVATIPVSNKLCPVGKYLRGFDGAGDPVCETWVASAGSNMEYVQLATSYHTSCAVPLRGAVKCWGAGGFGHLGTGDATDKNRPTLVRKIDGAAFVASKVVLASGATASVAGGGCGIQSSDSKVYCWGHNTYGGLGTGSAEASSNFAVPVAGLGAVQDISGGYLHFCAVDVGGAVWCWGYNDQGQLGDGSVTTRKTPVAVLLGGSPLTGMNRVLASAGRTSCAYNTEVGAVAIYCWGYNNYGQVGDGTLVSRNTATAVVTTAMSAEGVEAITGVYGAGDAQNNRGTICAVGKLTSGKYKAYCWGYNGNGQLMLGTTDTTTTHSTPTAATLLGEHNEDVALSMKSYSVCYLPRSGGEVKCLGYNVNGELGNGTTTAVYNSWVNVKGLGNSGTLTATRLDDSTGGYTTNFVHRCALLPGGRIACWGTNYYGQLGNGTASGAATGSTFPVGVLF